MKIVHANSLYYPAVGGNEIQTQKLSEGLVKAGDQVAVFTTNANKLDQILQFDSNREYLASTEMINGVFVKRFSHMYRLYSFIFDRMSKIRGCYRLRKLLFGNSLDVWEHGPFIPSMLWSIVRYKPDIILSINTYFATTYICYLAKKLFGVPLAISAITHTFDTWVNKPIVNLMLKSADCVFASTEFEKNYLIDQGINVEKITILGHGIDPGDFKNIEGNSFRKKYDIKDELLILFVGRKDLRKGVALLIEAMRIVWRQDKNAKLVLAGQRMADFDADYQKQIDALSDEDRARIIEIEQFTSKEKFEMFAACDIFAMPSTIDSFGIVYLEAWASGKPVIACKDTPQESIIDHEVDGLLVELGNKDDLAASILKLASNIVLRLRLGEAGRQKVMSRYTWDKIVQVKRKKYQEILANNK
ncbi:glycosyltransferase family 4 protein [Candidatus Omnitrophota bacterium]